ncbi:MAG: Desiccation/radiation resistance protein [Dehalococcoidia bacterium]|nr:Desiccation/radiation resistance protein [Chloroflexota bacterium]
MGDHVHSSPAVSAGTVFVGAWDGGLYALNAVDGELEWRYGTRSGIYSSPAVYEDMVYIGSGDGGIYAIAR